MKIEIPLEDLQVMLNDGCEGAEIVIKALRALVQLGMSKETAEVYRRHLENLEKAFNAKSDLIDELYHQPETLIDVGGVGEDW